ncbi:MAG: Gfo/Idh/MocA family oxidoreductase [Verrucomicrobiota bacterium]
MDKLRMGILSTADIAGKNWKAIFHSGNTVVSAVASRKIQKARDFIARGQREWPFAKPPTALEGYEALLALPDVDAVYVPVPTGLRKEWVMRAAEAGKHVVCEKPCGVSLADVQEMTAACRKHRVQFMDGVMYMHNRRLPRIRKVLDDGKSIGGVRRIASAFAFYHGEDFFRDNIRADGGLEPAGCLGDLGWYCIRFALWAMNWNLPRSVTGNRLSESKRSVGREPAPTAFSGELVFDQNVSCGFYCSFLEGFNEWVHVSGPKGWLQMADFVRPFDSYEPAFEVNRVEMRMTNAVKCPPGHDPMIQGHATAQDARMFRNFAKQVRSGKLNQDWPMWSLKTQQVMNACLESADRGRAVKL